jgi:hypothetical protein
MLARGDSASARLAINAMRRGQSVTEINLVFGVSRSRTCRRVHTPGRHAAMDEAQRSIIGQFGKMEDLV